MTCGVQVQVTPIVTMCKDRGIWAIHDTELYALFVYFLPIIHFRVFFFLFGDRKNRCPAVLCGVLGCRVVSCGVLR